MSSNPRRSSGGSSSARPAGGTSSRSRRPAPAPPSTPGLLERVCRTPAAVVHFFGHTPTTRQRVLPDTVTGARSRRRLTMTVIVPVLVFSIVVARLLDLQVLNPAAYARPDQRRYEEELPAERGSILDRNGLPLAITAPASSIGVDAKFMAEVHADPHADAALLASVLEPDPGKVAARTADIEAKMRDAGRQFAYVARQVTPDLVDKIKALKQEPDPTDPEGKRRRLSGVAFLDEPKRFRPAEDLARSLIGDVDGDGKGISGIERRYADDLIGQPGHILTERSARGQTIAPAQPEVEPAVRGRDIQLTIDRSLQYDTEQILSEQVRDAAGASGVAIVTRPDTGEILAMANVVSTRENGKVTDVRVSSKNSAMIEAYEPGSVMKLVTAAGALEEGVVRPDTALPVGPTVVVGGRTFGEAEPGHVLNGTATVSEIIARSSNVGTIRMSQKLGRDALYRYIRAFGFGNRTAVEFPDELAGDVPRPDKPDSWWDSSDGSVPIGQGISVTPLQMLEAYNTIANGGVYVPPRLLQARIDEDGTRHSATTDAGRRVVSSETANELNLILRSVVTDGTGTEAAIAGYTTAGKTGTARQVQANGYVGPDGRTHYDATFAGFVPAEAPALSVFVLVRDPADPAKIYGGAAAAPAFARIGAAALRRFNVAPPSTDLVRGGAAVDPSLTDPNRTPPATAADGTPVGTGLERTPDGRVKVRPAGETTTTAPPPPPSTAPARRSGTVTTQARR